MILREAHHFSVPSSYGDYRLHGAALARSKDEALTHLRSDDSVWGRGGLKYEGRWRFKSADPKADSGGCTAMFWLAPR